MSEFVDAGATTELKLNGIKAVAVGERRVALCHTAEGFFAVDNVCPHRGGPLSEGDLIGPEIVCPWHLWGFDIHTGISAGNPELCVPVYEVKVENDRVLVKKP